VYFLLIEDEAGLLQATMFEGIYRSYGHIVHQRTAFLLEGKVEQNQRRGFSILVERVRNLQEALAVSVKTWVPEPQMATSSVAFVRAKSRSRRATDER
jgi:error-prone DNA polymerase